MDRQSELQIIRRAYAMQVLAAAGVSDPRIENAFAAVRREDFLGPGPWQMLRFPGMYAPTPSADPVYLYTDQLIGIVPARGLNNGQPSFHASLLSYAAIAEGDHVVHVGAGTGYYTAMMAHLVGPTGRVTAIEFDAALAARARTNLESCDNVRVVEGDGAAVSFGAADVIYVNAGVTHPAAAWLDGLSDGGRLILPLTADMGRWNSASGGVDLSKLFARMALRGVVFLITRRGTEFDARAVSPVAIIPAESTRDPESEAALAAALGKGNWNQVTRLYRDDDALPEHCWLRGRGWRLAF